MKVIALDKLTGIAINDQPLSQQEGNREENICPEKGGSFCYSFSFYTRDNWGPKTSIHLPG